MALLTAIVHLVAYLTGPGQPDNETERQLMSLATTYRFPALGRTLWELLSGFSLIFSVYMATIGGIGLAVARRAADDVPLMNTLSVFYAGSVLTALVISLSYFFSVPTVFIGAVAVCFVAALVAGD
jgi:hypothetical protein